MARTGTLTVRVVGETRQFDKALGGLKKGLLGIGKFALLGGAALAAGIGAGVIGSVRSFISFDDKLNQSLAIMGNVSDAMRDDMSDAARTVAKTTRFSAEQAAESYFFLASAGLDAKQSIAALPQVAAFAQAGMFDMATATDLATDAQSALGLTVDDSAKNLDNLTRITDVLVKANTLSNAKVEEFSQSLTQKGAEALRRFNIPLEEGVAILAAFADQGLKGDQAGTILARTLSGLEERGRKSADQFAALGITIFDADGEMRNMADIVADLESGLAGMSTEQRTATLAQLGFNERAQRGIGMLLGNSEALREYESDLRDAAGTTQEVADKQLSSFAAKWDIVKSKIVDVGLSIGEALIPFLEAFMEWLDQHLPAITGWFDRVSEKFNDLLGVSEDTSRGTRTAASQMRDGWETSLSDMGTRTDRFHDGLAVRFGRDIPKHIDGLETRFGGFADDTGEKMDLIGLTFDRVKVAWFTIWNDDIKPWFMNTMIPWITDDLGPALGRAMWAAGKTAGKALAAALLGAVADLNKSLADWLETIPGVGRAAAGALEIQGFVQQSLSDILNSGGSTSTTPTVGEFQLGRFHHGGVVPGRPGQEVPIMAMAGETVLPTQRSAAGGSLTIPIHLDGREITRVVVDNIAQAARRGGTLVARVESP